MTTRHLERSRTPYRWQVGLLIACVSALATTTPAIAQDEAGVSDVPLRCGARSDGPAEPPAGALEVTYHGVSTLMFSDGRNRLLIDGFFSRPSLSALLLPLASDEESVRAGLGTGQAPVRAVLVCGSASKTDPHRYAGNRLT